MLDQPREYGGKGPTYFFIEKVLREQYFVVHAYGVTKSTMKVAEGIPQGNVSTPLFCNLIMTLTLMPWDISNHSGFPVRITLYADDEALGCGGRTIQAQFICASLQDYLLGVSCRLRIGWFRAGCRRYDYLYHSRIPCPCCFFAENISFVLFDIIFERRSYTSRQGAS